MVTRIVVAVVSVAVLCLAGCAPGPSEMPTWTPPPSTPVTSPGPTETPTPTPTPPTPAWSDEQQAAVDAVEKWFLIYNEVLQGERGPGDFVLAGRREIVDDAGLTYNQFKNANLTVKGDIVISALTPGEPSDEERQTVLVAFCQDTTGWQVLDESGKDTLKLEAKVVRPLAAVVEEWPGDGWYLTSLTKGDQKC